MGLLLFIMIVVGVAYLAWRDIFGPVAKKRDDK